ncbi:MAG TPA: glycosyltransferase [Gemmataceae bacterium]|jgi:GT2 family glycosyltransferase|nr:glycosyltransferase [Gemmataceae bacterium]
MRATIAIASCNEGELLARTVHSCLETTAGLDCEVVVADDASEDGSAERLRRRFPGVRVVSHAERRGVSLTKDLAARCARGDVLVFLDAHCKPEAGAIASLVAGVEELGGDAVLTPGIAGLDVDRWQSDLDQVGHGYAIALESFDLWWVQLEDLGRYQRTRFYAQPTFIGCCAAMSRKLYDHLWGFDTGMRCYGSEDVDFGVRAWLMGHAVLHDPGSVIGHRFREEFDDYKVPAEHLLANQLRMARKTFSDAVWFDWLQRFSQRQPAALWESAWRQYLEGCESVERERAYQLAHRVHDEFWYARTFGQSWPGTPAPAGGPTPGAAAGPVTAGGAASGTGVGRSPLPSAQQPPPQKARSLGPPRGLSAWGGGRSPGPAWMGRSHSPFRSPGPRPWSA